MESERMTDERLAECEALIRQHRTEFRVFIPPQMAGDSPKSYVDDTIISDLLREVERARAIEDENHRFLTSSGPFLCRNGIEHPRDEGRCLYCRAEVAEAKVAALEAVVARLPKTADGVSILPGTVLWDGNGQEWEVREVGGTTESMPPNAGLWPEEWATEERLGWSAWCKGGDKFRWWNCYSTRKAAEAAKEGGA